MRDIKFLVISRSNNLLSVKPCSTSTRTWLDPKFSLDIKVQIMLTLAGLAGRCSSPFEVEVKYNRVT